MQVLSEYYVTVTRKFKPAMTNDAAWTDVQSYLAWRPQTIDAALLRRAHEIEKRYRLSWWDGMVVAAAQLQDCAVLLTEDLHDGATFGDVTVRSPFTLAVEAPRASYTVASGALRHPSRGRPRKPEKKIGTAGQA